MQISDRQRHACMDLRCEICMWEESREANFLCGECRDNERVCELNAAAVSIHVCRFRYTGKDSQSKKETEVAVVRVKITLACEECKQRNYNLTKDKKTHPDRMETKKYCKFCKAHTMHKETK